MLQTSECLCDTAAGVESLGRGRGAPPTPPLALRPSPSTGGLARPPPRDLRGRPPRHSFALWRRDRLGGTRGSSRGGGAKGKGEKEMRDGKGRKGKAVTETRTRGEEKRQKQGTKSRAECKLKRECGRERKAGRAVCERVISRPSKTCGGRGRNGYASA